MNDIFTEIKLTTFNLRFFIILLGGILLYLNGTEMRLVIIGIMGFLWFSPRLIIPVYKIWMTIGMGIGFVMNTILLSVLFFISIVPIGILMKTLGKAPLDLSFKDDKATYWNQRKKVTREKYLKQY